MNPLLDIIEKHWGYRTLRPLQAESMAAFLDGRDSVTVLPTGGGKSLCYQAPALLVDGVTVVVSPLISLMKDQVDSLRENGIAAVSFDSSQSGEDRQMGKNDLLTGQARLLFASPERLMGGGFQSFLRQLNVQRFAIDEAHCVSHWGHDFRPEYRQMGRLKELFPGASVHAFTATATEKVRRDIAAQLQLHEPEVLVGSFDRPNLAYRVIPRRDLYRQIRQILDRRKTSTGHEPGIIYCIRRKDVDSVAALLKGDGYNALPYHAGMTPDQRHEAQQKFSDETCDIIVATVAFGMGIDRSNVRYVVHAGMPKSVEHYQQEAGRAGRDGLEAECTLLYSAQDTLTWQSIIEKSAEEARQAGTDVDPEYVGSALKHLGDMDGYARGAVCRHKALVEYFGQKYQGTGERGEGAEKTSAGATGCSACDLCLNETETVDNATVIAQKILSAVYRTGQRSGVGHVIEVLRGQNTEKVRQFRHDQLSVFGIMNEFDEKTIRDFVFQLAGQNLLERKTFQLQNGREYSTMVLTNASTEVLKGQRQVRLVQPAAPATKGKSRGGESSAIPQEAVDTELFEALRAWRRQVAQEHNVPPFVIFSDATLRALAAIRPTSMEKLRLIYGIGQKKLAELGPRVLPIIVDHCQARDLSTDVAVASGPSVPAAPRSGGSRINPEREQAFRLFQRGASIEETSEQTGRARSTIAEYLADFIAETKPPEISAWVPPSAYDRILESVRRVGGSRLKPIYVDLNEQFDYDQIRLVIAHAKPA